MTAAAFATNSTALIIGLRSLDWLSFGTVLLDTALLSGTADLGLAGAPQWGQRRGFFVGVTKDF